MKKRIFLGCLILVLALVQTGAVFATVEPVPSQSYQVMKKDDLQKLSNVPQDFIAKTDSGDFITVHINPTITDSVDGAMVQDIIESNRLKNGEAININDIGYAQNNATAKGGPGYNTTFSYGIEREAEDKRVTSAAKGEEVHLSQEWSYTIYGELESGATVYDLATVQAKLGGSVTRRYSVTHIFKGPAESSKYNSREFKVRYYRQKVTVKQVNEAFPSIQSTFKFDKAVRSASYSIDSIVRK